MTRRVSEVQILAQARIPYDLGDNPDGSATCFTFSGLMDDAEHIAMLYGERSDEMVVRVHSECLTGEVFHSLLCDCRQQLHEAIARFAGASGLLIYLRQEGRGIGLKQKIRAYQVQQEQALDTYAANRHLGHGDDLRDFRVAGQMLQALGVRRVRLLTNNQQKVSQLQEMGIEVLERLPTGYYESAHNRGYLQSKQRHGHSW